MDNDLRRILRRHSPLLVGELTSRLQRDPGSRYGKVDPPALAERCGLLAEALISAAHQGTDRLGEFVARASQRRLAEGFELGELQRALRILEVIAWQVVVRESAPESLMDNLSTLNTAMGHARDELARVGQAHAFAAAS